MINITSAYISDGDVSIMANSEKEFLYGMVDRAENNDTGGSRRKFLEALSISLLMWFLMFLMSVSVNIAYKYGPPISGVLIIFITVFALYLGISTRYRGGMAKVKSIDFRKTFLEPVLFLIPVIALILLPAFLGFKPGILYLTIYTFLVLILVYYVAWQLRLKKRVKNIAAEKED